jgi:hypothetical protein
MKRLLTLGCGIAFALTMMDFPQVVKTPLGFTVVKGGSAFAADMSPPPPPPPMPAPIGKGKAPVVGKGKAPVMARG